MFGAITDNITANRTIAARAIPTYNKRYLKGTLPMNNIIMHIPKIITDVDRFSDIISPQTIAIGNMKYFVMSIKFFSSF